MKLSTENISKTIQKRPIVAYANISVMPGEAVGLLGPNGAGKTTCFSLIAGISFPDGGTIMMDGQNITRWPLYQRARSGLTYLPQETSLFKGLSVEDNILTALEVAYPKDIDERYHRLDHLLDEFHISHLRGAMASILSGGEKRRLEIARALALNPRYLLLDEPLAGIDPIAVGDIKNIVMHLKSKGIGVLITDHNVRETLGIVDRAYIMLDGKIFAQGTPEELLNHTDVKRVYFGDSFSF